MISRTGIEGDIREFPRPPPFHILALSGGGYRGLFTAEILSGLESRLQVSEVGSKFQLLCGTSVGGLIAAGLALGRPASSIRDAIKHHGKKVFDDRFAILGRSLPIRKPLGPIGGFFHTKYSSKSLFEAIEDVLGCSNVRAKISDVPKPLILVATCVTSKAPIIISNLEPLDQISSEISLLDALAASCSAPVYFSPVRVGQRALVDGGLVANAPDLLAITEALRKKVAALDNCYVLSVGTAPADPGEIPWRSGPSGLWPWLPKLLPLALHAQERLIVRQANILLGERFWRINIAPSPIQSQVVALDVATAAATRTLLYLAEQALAEIEITQLRRWFEEHRD